MLNSLVVNHVFGGVSVPIILPTPGTCLADLSGSALQCEEIGYPQVVPSLAFSVPFPETFDLALQLSRSAQYGGAVINAAGAFQFADQGDDKIDTIVFPEAKSASLLSEVLQQSSGRQSPAFARETLSAEIIDHARAIVSTPWRDGSRFAALSLAYT